MTPRRIPCSFRAYDDGVTTWNVNSWSMNKQYTDQETEKNKEEAWIEVDKSRPFSTWRNPTVTQNCCNRAGRKLDYHC